MKNIFVALILIFGFHLTASGFQQKPEANLAHQDERLQSMLWVQTSLEYRAACAQVYTNAKNSLDVALMRSDYTAAAEQAGTNCSSKPPAVILDVDETVLDNSPMQAKLVAANSAFNRPQWNEWCFAAIAEPIEGVVPFIQYARSKNVDVFFVTNRDAELDKPTADNLTKILGYTVTTDMVMCKKERPDWTSNKSTRRAEVAKDHRIVMLIGDQFGDFMHIDDVSPEQRIDIGSSYLKHMGRSWILLPNPNYGDWEQALYDYDFSLSREEAVKRKAANLKPWKM